jgi:hypothetical protein
MSNNKALPLKLKDSDGNLQQINASDKNYIAYLAGIHTAQADSSDVGLLTTTASGNRLIGTLEDTYYPEPVGTHPYNASSVVATSTNLYQINGTASLADSDVRKPIAHYDANIYEQNDTDVNSFVDEINGRIATSDYAGSLKLSATAPSGDYTILVPSILTDQRADSSGNPYTVNDYSIWRRTNMSAPTNILNDVGGISSIMGIKRSSGATGTYQGVEKLTDRQITQSIGQRAKTRRAIQGNVGSYDLRTSSQGAPTASGQTWTAKGSATNTIRLVDEVPYTRSRVSAYARTRVSNYSQAYNRTRSSNYAGNFTGNYARDFVGNYNRQFVGNYTGDFLGNYTRNFAGNYVREYVGEYVGNYVGDYSRNFTGNYTRGFVGNYNRTFVGNYSRIFAGEYTRERDEAFSRTRIENYSRGFLGEYARAFVGNYAGNYIGEYTRISVRTRYSNYTRTSTRTRVSFYTRLRIQIRSSNYTNIFTRNYTRTSTQSFQGNYSGAQGTGASTFSNATKFVGNYSRQFFRDFTRTSTRNYERTRSESYLGNFTSDYTGNYVGAQGTGASVVSGENVFVGNYSRNFLGNYIGAQGTGASVVSGENVFVGNYTRNRVSSYYRNYTITRNSNYTGNFLREYSLWYTRTYASNYTGNYTTGYTRTNNIASARMDSLQFFTNTQDTLVRESSYATTYFRVTSTRFSTSARTEQYNIQHYVRGGRSSAYSRGTIKNSTGAYIGMSEMGGLYTGPGFARFHQKLGELRFFGGPTNYAGDYIGNFIQAFTRFFAGQAYHRQYTLGAFGRYRTAISTNSFTRTSSGNPAYPYNRTIVDTYIGNYARDYTRTSNRNYLRNSTQEYTRTSQRVTSTRTRISTFLGNYSRDFIGEYARGYSRNYTRERVSAYVRTRNSSYTGNYAGAQGTGASIVAGEGVFVGDFTRNFQGNYLGNYFRNFAGNFIGDYTREFGGNFLGDYTRTSTRTRIPTRYSSYARTRVSNYARPFVGNYTGDFVGDYVRNRSSSYIQNRVSSYSRTRVSAYTRSRTSAYSQAYSDTYTGAYSRNFNRTRVSAYTTERDEAFSRTRNSAYSRTRSSAYARTSTRTSTRDFGGNYTGDYTRSFAGDYARTFVGNYIGQTIGNTVFNVETYTLYVRTA